jgi:hypothetical protein
VSPRGHWRSHSAPGRAARPLRHLATPRGWPRSRSAAGSAGRQTRGACDPRADPLPGKPITTRWSASAPRDRELRLSLGPIMSQGCTSAGITRPPLYWEEANGPVPQQPASRCRHGGPGRPSTGRFRDDRRRWRPPRSAHPGTSPETACRTAGTGTIGTMTTAPAYGNSVRIGCIRVFTRAQGTPGPARRARRGALPGDRRGDPQRPRRPAQAARGPGPAAVRRLAGDLQAGSPGP